MGKINFGGWMAKSGSSYVVNAVNTDVIKCLEHLLENIRFYVYNHSV